MPDIRLAAEGVVWFQDPQPIHRLMKIQSSAMRSAYQAIHKHGLKDNDVKVHIKKRYGEELNGRYISDAVSRSKGIKQPNAIFGDKKNWKNAGEPARHYAFRCIHVHVPAFEPIPAA